MRRPVLKLGKVGNIVYGKNRHGQTCYAKVISLNPRTAPQQANRAGFGATGSGWGLLKDAERALWDADARNYKTHGRPGHRAPMTGFQRYMSVNAKRARQGLPPLVSPPVAASRQSAAISRTSLPPTPPTFHPPLLAFSYQPITRLPTPRAPIRYRSATVATPLRHRWTPFPPPCAPLRARAGPGPPVPLRFHPKSCARKSPAPRRAPQRRQESVSS